MPSAPQHRHWSSCAASRWTRWAACPRPKRSRFQADTAPDKRAKLIDDLLEKPEFADYRALRLSDLLRVNPRKIGNGNSSVANAQRRLFYEWIWNSVGDNKPWDQFVRELITARGSTFQNGPANFYRIERQANDRMENIGQAFLGVRMSCARCHKHPFDRWTTDDYWNFAAFMQKVSGRGGRLYDEEIIGYNHGAQVSNKSVTGRNRGKVAPATYLGDKQPAPEQPDMIVGLADWMTDPEKPVLCPRYRQPPLVVLLRQRHHPSGRRYAGHDAGKRSRPAGRAGQRTGRQQVRHQARHSADPELANLSAFRRSERSPMRRTTASSRTSCRKPMPAQALLDMMNQATGAQEQFGNFPERTRAVQAAMPIGNGFLDAFGQSHREFLADIDPKLEPNLVQTLMMINSPYIENKVDNGTTTRTIVKDAKTDEDVVQECYLRTFCRAPTPVEMTKATALIANRRKNRARRRAGPALGAGLPIHARFLF